MSNHTLHNDQSAIVAADQWDGDSLVFTGTEQASTVTFTGPNTLASVTDIGAPAWPGHASIDLMPGAALTTGRLSVNAANLAINERPGASVAFDGISRISNDSTLTATGYAGTGLYTLDGTMTIDGSSTVNMDAVAVSGTGTFHLTGDAALLRVGAVAAGETVALDGGMLSLADGMSFLGTITDAIPAVSRIGPTASVDVYNALDAVRETFDPTTGMLDLYNAQGTEVTGLRFAGTGELYAAPTTSLPTNYIAITSHPTSGALPVTLIH